MRRSSVVGGAAILGITSLLSRVVGVLRDRTISSQFGAGPETDAFLAAFKLPDTIYNLLVLGAVTAGFIPVFAAILAKKKTSKHQPADRNLKQAWQFSSRLLVMLAVSLGLASLVGIILAPWLVPILVPGFAPETLQQCIMLTRIMFISPVILGFSSVFGGALQSLRQFLAYSLAPIFYNLGIITGALFLTPKFGIAGLAYGVILGALSHVGVQWLACRSAGFRFGFNGNIFDGNIRKVLTMMVPRTLALGIAQLNTLVLTGIASTLGVGSVAVLWFAGNLQSVPVGVIGISFAVASFPLIAELLARGDKKAAAHELGRVVRMVLYLVIPATVLLVLLRAQAVRLVLGTGQFNWEDTVATIDVLGMFSLGIFAQALSPILARAFFALEDAVTPLVVAVGTVLVERILASWLVGQGFGLQWVAFAASAGSIVGLGLLWVLLRRRLGSLGDGRTLHSLIILTAAGALMAVGVQWTKNIVAPLVDMTTFVGVFGQAVAAIIIGSATYLVTTWLLGNEEARLMVAAFHRRLAPSAGAVVMQDSEQLDV